MSKNNKTTARYQNPDDAPNNEGRYYSNRWIPLKSVVPEAKINPKAGELVKVAISANLSADYEGSMGLDLHNLDLEDSFLGNDWHYVESKNKKLQAYFEIHILKDGNYKSMENAALLLAYNPLSKNDQLIMSDFKIELVDKDPFVTTEAQTKHVSVKPCAQGMEFTINKLSSDINWQGNFDINCKNFDYDAWISINNNVLDEKKSVTLVWPFCEKGKTYAFDCTWTDVDGKWHCETVKVIATSGNGELNIKALDNIKLSLESKSKEANLYAANLKVDSLLDVTKKYSDIIKFVGLEFPFVSGKKDWSDTDWIFGDVIEIYPNLNKDKSFYNELFASGKSNILGDHNFWWGDKIALNKALSARPTFWTEMRIHYEIIGYPEGAGFTIGSKRIEAPFTPVKF